MMNEHDKRIKKLLDIFGFSYDNYKAKKCVICGQNALDNCTTPEGIREVSISGICEKCFDKITTESSVLDE